MPELPEVETSKRGIAPHLLGKKLEQLIVRERKLRWPVPESLSQMKGCSLLSLERRGKYLLFEFASGVAIVHLGMSGSLRVVEADEPPMAHDHIDLVFEGGTTLRYTDPRKFGCMLWQTEPVLEHSLLAHLGPEPLSDEFSAEHLFHRSRNKKQAVKTFIMDSKVVVGVGNIYANEALFTAGIDPQRAAGGISKARYQRLYEAIVAVLEQAIKQGGTTLKDFVGGDGKPGYFKQELNVYGRAEQPCVTCKKPLTEIRLGQRSTVFCRRCQR